MAALHAFAFAVGAALILFAASPAVRMIVVPRGIPTLIARAVFVVVRRVITALIPRNADYTRRDRVLAYYAPDPQRGDDISVTREEWEQACDYLSSGGAPLREDRDAAWLDFAGWRVNYDSVLLALAGLTVAPPAVWSGDRALSSGRRPTRGRR